MLAAAETERSVASSIPPVAHGLYWHTSSNSTLASACPIPELHPVTTVPGQCWGYLGGWDGGTRKLTCCRHNDGSATWACNGSFVDDEIPRFFAQRAVAAAYEGYRPSQYQSQVYKQPDHSVINGSTEMTGIQRVAGEFN